MQSLNTACIYLAAGHSRRFGDANKLLAMLNGKPLVAHAAQTIRSMSLAHRITIVADNHVAAQLNGFDILYAKGSQNTMSCNIALGVTAAQARGADRVLIALADMPFVPREHFEAVIAACDSTHASASSDGTRHLPPACFPESYFEQLMALTGENGAGKIIKYLPAEFITIADSDALADIDKPTDLRSGLQNGKPMTEKFNAN
jgi:molybdenum cofactor cytidylyltransferase